MSGSLQEDVCIFDKWWARSKRRIEFLDFHSHLMAIRNLLIKLILFLQNLNSRENSRFRPSRSDKVTI